MLTIILNFVIDYKKHIQILAVIAHTIQVNNDYKKSSNSYTNKCLLQ